MWKMLKLPLLLFAVGALLGISSRALDLYSQTLGDVFSQTTVWILFGTLISVYSPTRQRAMLNILPFCAGMLITYYAAAAATDGVYSMTYIIGWSVFALCTPVFAYLTRMSAEDGLIPFLLRIGIVAISVLSSIVLFRRLRLPDLILNGVLIFFLFFRKIPRK